MEQGGATTSAEFILNPRSIPLAEQQSTDRGRINDGDHHGRRGSFWRIRRGVFTPERFDQAVDFIYPPAGRIF